jgi:hypothetical protein
MKKLFSNQNYPQYTKIMTPAAKVQNSAPNNSFKEQNWLKHIMA